MNDGLIYSELAQESINSYRPKFQRIREIGNAMHQQVNKLDKRFYLAVEDELSVVYDDILEKYLEVKNKAEEAEATIKVAIEYSYNQGENKPEKKPTAPIIEAMVKSEIKDIAVAEALLEAQYKIVKNYLQTCRNHIAAVTGRDVENNNTEE